MSRIRGRLESRKQFEKRCRKSVSRKERVKKEEEDLKQQEKENDETATAYPHIRKTGIGL